MRGGVHSLRPCLPRGQGARCSGKTWGRGWAEKPDEGACAQDTAEETVKEGWQGWGGGGQGIRGAYALGHSDFQGELISS